MATEYLEANKPIQFFRITVTENHPQGKLLKPCMLPRKFVKKYGEGLAKVISLKTPNGEHWKINLVNKDGKIWFGEGWKQFADYHSLGHGHLLVFKYQRHSEFHVDIFDTTNLEIEYPSNNEEDCRTSNKRKAISSFELGSTSCAMHHTHKKSKGKPVNATLERAKEFKTCNPSFILVMAASYAGSRFNLALPLGFGKTHFNWDKKKGDISFRVSDDERVWPALYIIRMSTGRREKFEVTCGWKKFVEDNNLKVGDVCNFELILRTNMTFQVHIFRKINEVNTDCSNSAKSYQIKYEAAQGLRKGMEIITII